MWGEPHGRNKGIVAAAVQVPAMEAVKAAVVGPAEEEVVEVMGSVGCAATPISTQPIKQGWLIKQPVRRCFGRHRQRWTVLLPDRIEWRKIPQRMPLGFIKLLPSTIVMLIPSASHGVKVSVNTLGRTLVVTAESESEIAAWADLVCVQVEGLQVERLRAAGLRWPNAEGRTRSASFAPSCGRPGSPRRTFNPDDAIDYEHDWWMREALGPGCSPSRSSRSSLVSRGRTFSADEPFDWEHDWWEREALGLTVSSRNRSRASSRSRPPSPSPAPTSPR